MHLLIFPHCRRSNHNEMERKRRMQQKNKINDLKEVVPTLAGRKASTVMIVNKAREYILFLENKLKELSTRFPEGFIVNGRNGLCTSHPKHDQHLNSLSHMPIPLAMPPQTRAYITGQIEEAGCGNYNANSPLASHFHEDLPSTVPDEADTKCYTAPLPPFAQPPQTPTAPNSANVARQLDVLPNNCTTTPSYKTPTSIQLPPIQTIDRSSEQQYQEPGLNMLYQLTKTIEIRDHELHIGINRIRNSCANESNHDCKSMFLANGVEMKGAILCIYCNNVVYNNEPMISCQYCYESCHLECMRRVDVGLRMVECFGKFACVRCCHRGNLLPPLERNGCVLEK